MISVIMPALNAEATVGAQLLALSEQQADPGWEPHRRRCCGSSEVRWAGELDPESTLKGRKREERCRMILAPSANRK